MDNPTDYPIVFFDNTCNLCSSSVQFVLRHDKSQTIHFAPLDSKISEQFGLTKEMDSVVFIEHGKVYTKTAALLRVTRYFGWKWSMLRALLLVPSFLRNILYDLVAHHRHSWFGERNTCLIPTPDIKDRFL